jgi:hypothetical protein
MPHYFFHTFNGHSFPDMAGTELPGLEEARRQAVRTAGQIIRDSGSESWHGPDWHMEVTDGAGHAMLWLRFSVEELSDAAM